MSRTCLNSGEVDACFHAAEPRAYSQGYPNIRRLFPDYRSVEQAYFAKTGMFPIMHAVAIKKTLVESDPAIIRPVFAAYSQAKQAAYDYVANRAPLMDSLPWIGQEFEQTRKLMGENFYSYGITPNRKPLETLFRYSHELGLCSRNLQIEEIFAPGSIELTESCPCPPPAWVMATSPHSPSRRIPPQNLPTWSEFPYSSRNRGAPLVNRPR